MEDGEAVGTLSDALQVKGVDRVAVPADLADEALALAQDAGQDVLAAEPGGVAQKRFQFAGTNLFLVEEKQVKG